MRAQTHSKGRCVTLEYASYLRGKRYNSEKKAIPNETGSNQYKEVKGQNVPQPTTAERLGEEYGVSDKTIKRDAEFASSVDLIANVVGETARAMNLCFIYWKNVANWRQISDNACCVPGAAGRGKVGKNAA